MFEEIFERMGIGRTIGANIVDVTKDFTIKVSAAPPAEGKAVLISVETPSEFTPGTRFTVKITFRNDGGDDYFFARTIDRDTGETLDSQRVHLSKGTSWTHSFAPTLVQNTDFHGRVEIGHEI